MRYTWNCTAHLKKSASLGKMHHIRKNAAHLEKYTHFAKCGTLAKNTAHSQNCATVGKIRHTQENAPNLEKAPHLEKCGTLGKVKVKNDHRSKFSNLSSWIEEA